MRGGRRWWGREEVGDGREVGEEGGVVVRGMG